MRPIEYLVVHCSDTPADMDIGYVEIFHWHTDPKPKGNGWSNIGYHDIIRRSGARERGRPLEVAGAHARGYNHNSIGVCLVGGKGGANFTRAQFATLDEIILEYQEAFPGIKVIGHRQVSSKSCPSFDVRAYMSEGWS